METHKGCTYWYEVSMQVDVEGDGYRKPSAVRIPVRCEAAGKYFSKCTYLNPSSASVETENILNIRLFDSPYPAVALMETTSSKGFLEVSSEFLINVIDNRKPFGYFYRKEKNIFVAVDNSTGDAWTEEFDTFEKMKSWIG